MARTGVIYGDSGTHKSTAAKHFARYIYEKTGKETLLFSQDGGGWAPMEPEIQAGMILPYRCNAETPLSVIRKVSQGFFPEDPKQTMAERTNFLPIDYSRYGGMIVEGLSSISQAIMRYLADKGVKTGEEATNQFGQNIIVNGKVETEKFAGNSRGHYGFVQNALYSMVTQFSSLPMEYVLFTALESRTEDDDKSTIYGPQIAGKKATNLVPSWLGDCIHAQGYAASRVVKVPDPSDRSKMIDTTVVDTIVRMYFTKHPDPNTGIMFPAKPRVTPEKIAELMKLYPGGYFEPTVNDGFDKYLQAVDSLSTSQAADVTKWRDEQDRKFGRGKYAQLAAGALAVAAPAQSK